MGKVTWGQRLGTSGIRTLTPDPRSLYSDPYRSSTMIYFVSLAKRLYSHAISAPSTKPYTNPQIRPAKAPAMLWLYPNTKTVFRRPIVSPFPTEREMRVATKTATPVRIPSANPSALTWSYMCGSFC
jgi:hypothetical protein